jgi:hypothetical protein
MIDRSVCENCDKYHQSDAHKDKWWCCFDEWGKTYDARILESKSDFPEWCDKFKYAILAGMSKKSKEE